MVGVDVILFVVGILFGKDGLVDLLYIFKVVEMVVSVFIGWVVIVIKFMVLVGMGDKIEVLMCVCMCYEFVVVLNLEFFKEGDVVNDFMKLDCVIVGVEDKCVVEVLCSLYVLFMCMSDCMLVMDWCFVELIKYVVNLMLVMWILFMNDLVNLCEIFGCDIEFVCKGMGLDFCIGFKFLFVGFGFGGSCFFKDLCVCINIGCEVGYDFEILNVVVDVNEC